MSENQLEQHRNERVCAVSQSYLRGGSRGQGRCDSFLVLLMRSCCGKVLPEGKLRDAHRWQPRTAAGVRIFQKKSAHKSRRAQTARVRRAHNKAKKLVRKPLRFSAAVKTFN